MAIDINDYKDSNGWIDYERFNADLRQQRRQHYDNAIGTFVEAQRLARANGAYLFKCSEWHFKLKIDGFIYHLYPYKQGIGIDKYNPGPFLKVDIPWTFIDIVATALVVTQKPNPELLGDTKSG